MYRKHFHWDVIKWQKNKLQTDKTCMWAQQNCRRWCWILPYKEIGTLHIRLYCKRCSTIIASIYSIISCSIIRLWEGVAILYLIYSLEARSGGKIGGRIVIFRLSSWSLRLWWSASCAVPTSGGAVHLNQKLLVHAHSLVQVRTPRRTASALRLC